MSVSEKILGAEARWLMGRVMPREIRHPHRGESEYRPHERGRAIDVVRRIGLLIVAAGLTIFNGWGYRFG
jgi:membrane protein YqaA with SNARE-associated domain